MCSYEYVHKHPASDLGIFHRNEHQRPVTHSNDPETGLFVRVSISCAFYDETKREGEGEGDEEGTWEWE